MCFIGEILCMFEEPPPVFANPGAIAPLLSTAGFEVLYEEQDFRMYQSTSLPVFAFPVVAVHTDTAYECTSLPYLAVIHHNRAAVCLHVAHIAVLRPSGPTGTFGNSVPRTKQNALGA